MDELLKFFDGDSWTLDYKKEILPTYEHYAHLVNWAVDDSNWPYLPIDLPNADYKSMFKEALQVTDLLVEHRDSESHKGWSSVCVHGEAYNRTRAWNDYEDNQGKTEKDIKYGYCKEVVDRCPTLGKDSGGAEKGLGQTPGTEPSCPTPEIKDPVPPPCPIPEPSGGEDSAMNGTFGIYPRAREEQRTQTEVEKNREAAWEAWN